MSETGIPVTEQDQSLVQRLRDYPSYEECLQAADRIEALEKRLLGAQLVHESDQRSYLQQSNRIHALELDNARLMIDGNQLRELCQLRYDRIEALEDEHNRTRPLVVAMRQRIEALEKRWDLQVDNAVRAAAERISQLEAALREIITDSGTGWVKPHPIDIARRALEAGTKAGTGSAVLTAQE